MVSVRIIFSDLVTGGRKKTDDECHVGIQLSQRFDDGPSLFKFSQRSAMHPNTLIPFYSSTGYGFEDSFSAIDPGSRFPVPRRNDTNTYPVQPKKEVI